jgi:hypothetical protein
MDIPFEKRDTFKPQQNGIFYPSLVSSINYYARFHSCYKSGDAGYIALFQIGMCRPGFHMIKVTSRLDAAAIPASAVRPTSSL